MCIIGIRGVQVSGQGAQVSGEGAQVSGHLKIAPQNLLYLSYTTCDEIIKRARVKQG